MTDNLPYKLIALFDDIRRREEYELLSPMEKMLVILLQNFLVYTVAKDLFPDAEEAKKPGIRILDLD